MPLPRILAGPILRRTELTAVWIWLCTSEDIEVGAEIYLVTDDHQLGMVIGRTEERRYVQLGPHLFVHLIKASPLARDSLPSSESGFQFEHTRVLGYRLLERRGSEERPLREFDETLYGIGQYRFPTFVIQNPRSNALRALFCSCRKLHGNGSDASIGMRSLLERNLFDDRRGAPLLRPTALFLLGDQIYADDVCDIIFPNIIRMAHDLRPETLPGLSLPPEQLGIASRLPIIVRQAGFTSHEASNHLMTLGEYAAMYLLAWNEAVWDPESMWPRLEELFNVVGEGGRRSSGARMIDYAEKWNQWRENLLNGKQGSRALSQLLANVPTYMMFDDHDVTDDWNINPSWERHVSTKALGKRVLTNALIAYWAFQGWGNDPDSFDASFVNRLNAYLTGEQPTDYVYSYLCHNIIKDWWSFKTPTKPSAIFLDFRTQRTAATNTPPVVDITFERGASQSLPPHRITSDRIRETRLHADLGPNNLDGTAPRLMNSSLKLRARQLMQGMAGTPIILVTGTPIVGAGVIEYGQELAIYYQGSFTWDFESWRGDPESLLDLYTLIRDANPSVCAILSGDVHYGFSMTGQLSWPDGRRFNLGQFTSSSTKNVSFPQAYLLHLGDILHDRDRLASRWRYAGPASRDGVGVSTHRLVFEHPDELSLFPSFYCQETWDTTQISLTSGGFIRRTNFGWLVATNRNEQIKVQMYDATARRLGSVVDLTAE